MQCYVRTPKRPMPPTPPNLSSVILQKFGGIGGIGHFRCSKKNLVISAVSVVFGVQKKFGGISDFSHFRCSFQKLGIIRGVPSLFSEKTETFAHISTA